MTEVGYYNDSTLFHGEIGTIFVGQLYGFGAEFGSHKAGWK